MKIHFVGCEGVSMKVLARIMQSFGHSISGSDLVLRGHNANNIAGADLVVYTAAVGEDNIEVVSARQKGIRVLERAEFLGQVVREYKTVISVAGTHGKTTTTGFIEQIFLPLEPTVHIGGKTLGESGHIGGKEFFITEACEYKRSFLHIHSDIAVILNLELDHTDYYKSIDDYADAFKSFAAQAEKVIINGDDERLCALLPNALTFGLGVNCVYRADNIERTPGGYCFDIFERGKLLMNAGFCLSGRHNVYNALAAVAAARTAGLTEAQIEEGIRAFGGVKRRFEYVGNVKNSRIYTDYAHHPSEIKTTVLSARDTSDFRVTIVFEPHTYTRTKSLQDEFTEALSLADRIILCPIYAAREKPLEGVTSHNLVRALIQSGKKALHFDTFYSASEYISNTLEDGEIIVFTGAGDIERGAYLLVKSFS